MNLKEKTIQYYDKPFEIMVLNNKDTFTNDQIAGMSEEVVSHFIEMIENDQELFCEPIFKKFVNRIKDIHIII